MGEGKPRKIEATHQEMRWMAMDGLGSYWSKQLLNCHNAVLMSPDEWSNIDEWNLAITNWRRSSDYPFPNKVLRTV